MLVGSQITTRGAPNRSRVKAKVQKAKERMDRAIRIWGRQADRMEMVGSAAITVAVEGTQHVPLAKAHKETLRSKAQRVMWGDKYWKRSAVSTLTLLRKGHREDAAQAELYHNFRLWRRTLAKNERIRRKVERIWELRRGIENGTLVCVEGSPTEEHIGKVGNFETVHDDGGGVKLVKYDDRSGADRALRELNRSRCGDSEVRVQRWADKKRRKDQ